jgi:hypothetical protein
MARNVIAVCEAVIRMILSTFFVEVVKITPFSGSIFFKGSKPFLTGTVKYTVLHEVSYVGTMVLHTVGGKSSGTEYDQVGGTVRPVSCSRHSDQM